VELRDGRFSKPHVSLRLGGRVTWRFVDRTPHNVLYANGPRVVGSPTLSRGRSYSTHFVVPGHYELSCHLHPVTMHQVIEVQPR
jgi:plastocyanin